MASEESKVIEEEEALQSDLLGILASSGAASDRARRFIGAAKRIASSESVNAVNGTTGHDKIRIRPVISVRRKTYFPVDYTHYGDMAQRLEDDPCVSSEVAPSGTVGDFLRSWRDAIRTSSGASDVQIRERLARLSERFMSGSAVKGEIVIPVADVSAERACVIFNEDVNLLTSRDVRVLGPQTVDGGRTVLHPGDEVTMVGLILEPRSSDKNSNEIFNIDLDDHAKALTSAKSFDVFSDEKRDWVASSDPSAAKERAKTEPLSVYPSSVPKEERYVRTLSLSRRVVVTPARRACETLWSLLPTLVDVASESRPGSIREAVRLSGAASGTKVVSAEDFDQLKGIVELSSSSLPEDVSKNKRSDDVSSSSSSSDVPPSWLPALSEISEMVRNVPARNDADGKYVASMRSSIERDLKTLKKIASQSPKDCKNIEPVGVPMHASWWINASFRKPTASGDQEYLAAFQALPHGIGAKDWDEKGHRIRAMPLLKSMVPGRLPESASVVQGHLQLADLVVAARDNAAWYGARAMLHDHIRALDASCIATKAALSMAKSAEEAAGALESALSFAARSKGEDTKISGAERRLSVWSRVTSRMAFKSRICASNDARSVMGEIAGLSFGQDENDDGPLGDLVLSFADMPFYRRLVVKQIDSRPEDAREKEEANARAPTVLLTALTQTCGMDQGLTAEEQAAILNNTEYFAGPVIEEASAQLRRQVVVLKQKRPEIQKRLRLREDAYRTFEERLIAKLRLRAYDVMVIERVTTMAALVSILVESNTSRLVGDVACAVKAKGRGQMNDRRRLSLLIACAAHEVIRTFTSSTGNPRPPAESGGTTGGAPEAEPFSSNDAGNDAGNIRITDASIERDIIDKRRRIVAEKPAARLFQSSFKVTQVDLRDLRAPETAELVKDLQRHMQSQQPLVMGFDKRPLRHMNACCIAPVGAGAWPSLISADSSGALKRSYERAIYISKTQSTKPTTSTVPIASSVNRKPADGVGDLWWSVSPSVDGVPVKDPQVIVVAVDNKTDEDDKDIQSLARQLMASYADDDALARFAEGGDVSELTETTIRHLYQILAVLAIGPEAVGKVVDAVQSMSLGHLAIAFMVTDMLPAMRRVSQPESGIRVADQEVQSLAGRASEIASGKPEILVQFRDAMKALADRVSSAMSRSNRDVLISSRDSALSWHVVVETMRMLANDSVISDVSRGLAGILLVRLQTRLSFNDNDVEGARMAVTLEREQEKKRRKEIAERVSDEDRAFLRELRKVRGDDYSWDDVDRDFAKDEKLVDASDEDGRLRLEERDRVVRTNYEDAMEESAPQEEEARGFYWSEEGAEE